jgi:hypothetical protein
LYGVERRKEINTFMTAYRKSTSRKEKLKQKLKPRKVIKYKKWGNHIFAIYQGKIKTFDEVTKVVEDGHISLSVLEQLGVSTYKVPLYKKNALRKAFGLKPLKIDKDKIHDRYKART